MLFLIEYDRHRGQLKTFQEVGEADWNTAQSARLHLEIDLNRRGVDHEVVLLQATSQEALRKTHRRYFEDITQLVKPLLLGI